MRRFVLYTMLAVLILPSVLGDEVDQDDAAIAGQCGNGVLIAQYTLPLPIEQIYNYDNFSSAITLSDEARILLENNGFVVMDNPFAPKGEDITDPYDNLKEIGIPIFITTDSLLHLYHIQFDETLRQIEEREFYDDLWEISQFLLEEAEYEYQNTTGDAKEAAKRNVAFFSVGLSLLEPKEEQLCHGSELDCAEWFYGKNYPYFKEEDLEKYSVDVPAFVENEVDWELQLIESHSGFEVSPIFNYTEDYSQYLPRGHYTRSERLKNYFQAMMWYGRMSFLLKGCDDKCLVSAQDAKLQTIGASMIAQNLLEDPLIQGKWDRIYNVTSFYVGYSDDLGPYEYNRAINSVFGGSFQARDLTAEDVQELKAELAGYSSPEIYGGTGICVVYTPEELDQCLEATKGFRLMGQRFVPDSYIFQNLVYPKVDGYTGHGDAFTQGPYGRHFPRGLDVMALLGSDRSEELLEELNDSSYGNYTTQFAELEDEFRSFSEEDWQKNLYWAWLYSLKPLLEEFGDGYPTFMQTKAWQDKELITALASWAELRHDTILYAKQSYTGVGSAQPIILEPVVGYVEPVPEFYSRLLVLTRITKEDLQEMGVLDEEAWWRLNNLESILERLKSISTKELNNEELSDEDYEFINDFGQEMDTVLSNMLNKILYHAAL